MYSPDYYEEITLAQGQTSFQSNLRNTLQAPCVLGASPGHATPSGAAPVVPSLGDPGIGTVCGQNWGREHIFVYTGSGQGGESVDVDLCHSQTDFDTYLGVVRWTDADAALATAALNQQASLDTLELCVGANDDGGACNEGVGGVASRITFTADAETRYLIILGGYSPSSPGNFVLTLNTSA